MLARRSSVRLVDLPTCAPADLHADLLQRLHGDGLDVLLSVQPSEGEAVAVKALVPGLEVETMSYGRIGERGVRRLLERGDPLVAVGQRPPGFAHVHLTSDAQERLGGAAWFDRAGADARVGPLYALYREPGRHVVGALQRAAA